MSAALSTSQQSPSCFRAEAKEASTRHRCLLDVRQVSLGQEMVKPSCLFNSEPACREINGRFYFFTTQDRFTTTLKTDNKFFTATTNMHGQSRQALNGRGTATEHFESSEAIDEDSRAIVAL